MTIAATYSTASRFFHRKLRRALLRSTALAGAMFSVAAVGIADAASADAFWQDRLITKQYYDISAVLDVNELYMGDGYLFSYEDLTTTQHQITWDQNSTGAVFAVPGVTFTLGSVAKLNAPYVQLHFGSTLEWGEPSQLGTVVFGGLIYSAYSSVLVVVTVDGGTLRIGSSSIAQGLFNPQVGGQISIAVAGTMEINGYDMTLMNLSGAGILRNANEPAAAVTLQIFNSTNSTFSGVIEDGSGAGALSLDKTGPGTLTLSGANTYTGLTNVLGGTLVVNGSQAGAIDVLSGGTLQGSGTVGGVTVSAGATLAPGSAVDVLDVAGDLVFASGSSFKVMTDNASNSGLVKVSGTATLGGATVDVATYDPTVSYEVNQTYVILKAGALDGSFGEVNLDSAFIYATLSYADGKVFLNLLNHNIQPLGSVAVTANQIAVGQSVNLFDQTAGSGSLALYNAILFSNEANARDAFDLLSGEIHASLKTGLVEDSRQIRSAVIDRITQAFAAPATELGATPWMQGFGAWGSTGTDSNAADMDRSIGGVLLGADGFVSDRMQLGFVTGYSHSQFDVASSSAGVDSYHLGAYAGIELGGIVLKGGAAIAFNQIDTGRRLDFSGFSDSLSASYGSTLSQIFAEAAYSIDLGAVRLEPYAGLAHIHLATDGFSESGDAAALAGYSDRMDVTYSTLGIRGSLALPAGTMALTATGQLGWRHALGKTGPVSDLAFAGSDAFAVKGLAVSRDTALLDLGLSLAVAPSASLAVSYQGQFGSDLSDNGVSAKFAMTF